MNIISKIKGKILPLLKTHRVAIVIALSVALVYGAPQIISIYGLGSDYRGFPHLVNDSEGEYMGRIQEIFDGHYSVASSVFHEYKDSTALIPPTGEFVFYALPSMLTGLSLNAVIFLSRFVLPALVFVFIYLLIYSISERRSVITAIAGALLITVGASVINYNDFLSYLIHGEDEPALLWLSRLVNPVTGMVMLSALLLILWKAFEGRTSKWITACGIAVLSLMSGYVFSFALGLTISSLLALYFVWKKEWVRALYLAAIPLFAIIINGIYFYGALGTIGGSSGTSDPLRSGMFYTHMPTVNIVSTLVFVIVAVCYFYFISKDKTEENGKQGLVWWYLWAIVLSCLIVYCQQIITGIAVWPQHFAQYTVPLGMLVMIILLENVLRPRWRWLWVAGITGMLFVSITIGVRSVLTASGTMIAHRDQQTFVPVFDWLNNNAGKDCTVYVSSEYGNEINRFVAAFTHCDVYHSYYNYNGVPMERIMHNYLVNLRLRGVTDKDLENHIDESEFWMRAYFFRDWGDMFCCADPWLQKIKNQEEVDGYFDRVKEEIKTSYKEFLKGNIYEHITKYRVDYFVVDTEKQPNVNSKIFNFLKEEARFGRFVIYSVI
ncbi:MAG: hypothetical protein WCV79_01990 [Candidatus Paceibacterota bacterium]